MPTNSYKNSIYAPVRQTKAVVSFALVAPEAKEKATVSVPSNNPISRPHQLINNVTDIGAKMATFEPNYWKLDGSFSLPLPMDKTDFEVGWWGDKMSDKDGIFSVVPVIDVTFSEVQNIAMFGISFDEMTGEAVEDLEFIVYDSGNKIIYNERIRDNAATYAHTKLGAVGVKKISIKLYKTGNAFRYPRVGELDFGVVLKFDDKKLLDLNLITEADPTGKSFRLNSFSANVINNGEFDQLDKDSYAQYLYNRQAFEYKHGLVLSDSSVEWVYCGVYYLDNWSVSDDKVEFNALAKASTLEDRTFYESTFKQKTVAEMISLVLDGAKMDYVVADILKESPKIAGYFGNISYRQALTYLAELSCCLIYEDKHNTIQFVDFLGSRVSSDNIDYNNMFSAPKIKLEAYYNGIILKEKMISVTNEQIAQIEEVVSVSKDILIYFDKPLYADTAVCTVTSGFTLSNIVYSAMYMKATIKGNGTAKISVKGDIANFVQAEKFYAAPWQDPFEPDYGYAVDLPMMISAGQNWEPFRAWFLERKFKLLKKRLICDIAWRQNPDQEIGDAISVQANKNNKNVGMTAFMETLDYKNGVLTGITKAIGEVDA